MCGSVMTFRCEAASTSGTGLKCNLLCGKCHPWKVLLRKILLKKLLDIVSTIIAVLRGNLGAYCRDLGFLVTLQCHISYTDFTLILFLHFFFFCTERNKSVYIEFV